jgi:hypothetical protein
MPKREGSIATNMRNKSKIKISAEGGSGRFGGSCDGDEETEAAEAAGQEVWLEA